MDMYVNETAVPDPLTEAPPWVDVILSPLIQEEVETRKSQEADYCL